MATWQNGYMAKWLHGKMATWQNGKVAKINIKSLTVGRVVETKAVSGAEEEPLVDDNGAAPFARQSLVPGVDREEREPS
jgi:hypothetical protein